MEDLVSIVIPAYREPYLHNTLQSILAAATGNIEVIPVIDGYDCGPLPDDTRVRPLILSKNVGMRGAENAGISSAKGTYLMKADAHCVFARGFDEELRKNCEDTWLLVPRRYSVNEETWDRDELRRVRDYHYIFFPKETRYGFSLSSADWHDRKKGREAYSVDDTMSFQGSCWFAKKNMFMKYVGLLNDNLSAYSGFAHEQIEVGMNYWLKGGEVKVVKTTWYAHLSKRKHHYDKGMFSRRYKKNSNTVRSHTWSTVHWMNNKEPGIIHPFSWLIEKFWPVPTWDEDWEEKWKAYGL